MPSTREERDDGNELLFAVIMILLSLLIFLAIRRTEGSRSG
ncbi:MAG: hypothetical protein R6U01_08000 [Halorubrum sp.]